MKSNALNLLQILFLLNISNVICAQENRTITIKGKVVDYMARPVEGAEIAVYQELVNYDIYQDYAKKIFYLNNTDANGCFTADIDVLPILRPVFIIARKEGLALGWDVFFPSGQSENKIIILEKACILEGIVVDEKGHPVPGAKVQAVPKNSYLQRLEQRPVIEPKQWFSTKTDSKGEFRFSNFSADVSSDFWVEAPGRSITFQYTPNFMSAWGYEVGQKDIRLVLPREITVKGKVIDAESSDALEGVTLYLHPEDIREHKNPYYPKQIISDSNGTFSIKGVPPGKHRLNASFDKKTPYVDKRVKFEVNQDESVNEVLIEVNKGGLAEITILEASTKRPVSGLFAYFYESVQDENSDFYKDAVSDKDGIIRIWAPPEECIFNLDCSGYTPSRIENEHIMITKGQIAKREILLDHVKKISGIVIDENSEPVSEVLVMANPTGGTDYTDNEGRFEVSLEPERPFERLIAIDTKHNLASITEIGDISKPIQITLKPASSITGQITDPNGIGIPAARIDLTLQASGYLASLGEEVITDSKGYYQINAIPQVQEEMAIRISTYSSGYGTVEYKRISVDDKSEDKMTLKTIVLQPANQSLSGIVVDSNNIPAPGVLIVIHGKGQPTRNTVSDKNGRFTLNRICNGPLRIQAGLGNSDNDSGFINAEEIDENMKIILGQNLTHTKQISLTGKHIPDFNDFNINKSNYYVNDKVILICFFDIEQRPSRNGILELSKKAQELKGKNIIVVTIHAANIEKEYIDKWFKENSIDFPVGMIENDLEQTKFNWGIKALPWLILTDKKHIVQAEGFSVAELNENLENSNK